MVKTVTPRGRVGGLPSPPDSPPALLQTNGQATYCQTKQKTISPLLKLAYTQV